MLFDLRVCLCVTARFVVMKPLSLDVEANKMEIEAWGGGCLPGGLLKAETGEKLSLWLHHDFRMVRQENGRMLIPPPVKRAVRTRFAGQEFLSNVL